MISKLKSYFENHKEKNNEKLRSQEFEKLQAKLQVKDENFFVSFNQ